jgi:uncharacterized membrane protein YbaN (DUF454 family)
LLLRSPNPMRATQRDESAGSKPVARPKLSTLKRVILLGLGWIFLGLAIAGIPLPLLPTTPFLMLASACFMRSSPRLHERMLRDPRFGPLLAQWRRDRSIPRGAKRKAYFVIVLTFGISIAITELLLLRCALLAIGLGLIVFLARLRTGD